MLEIAGAHYSRKASQFLNDQNIKFVSESEIIGFDTKFQTQNPIKNGFNYSRLIWIRKKFQLTPILKRNEYNYFLKYNHLTKLTNGVGVIVLSTPYGLFKSNNCIKKNIGG